MFKFFLLIPAFLILLSGCYERKETFTLTETEHTSQASSGAVISGTYRITLQSDYENSISGNDDEAVWHMLEIPVEQGQDYVLNILNTGTGDSLTMENFGTRGSDSAEDSATVDPARIVSREYTADSSGTLSVGIRTPAGSDGSYRIRVNPADGDELVQDDTLYEPNNSPLTAYPISNSSRYYSGLEQGDEEDWYRFDMRSGSRVGISISDRYAASGTIAAERLRASLCFDDSRSNCQELDFENGTEVSETAYASKTAPMYIRIYNDDAHYSTVRSYRLRIRIYYN